MPNQSNPAQSTLNAGDDVIVTFPSGREVVGRIEELVGYGGKLYDIVVWVEDYNDSRIYPPRWVKAWEAD